MTTTVQDSPLLQAQEQRVQVAETAVPQMATSDLALSERWQLRERQATSVGGASTTSITTESTAAAVSSASSSSASPFFTSGTAEDSGGDDSTSTNITKVALEVIIAIAFFIALALTITCRYTKIRRKNQPLRTFIPTPNISSLHYRNNVSEPDDTTEHRRSLPRTTGLPSMNARDISSRPGSLSANASLFYPPSLAHGRYPVVLEPLPAHLADSLGTIRRGEGGGRGRNSSRAARGADIDAGGRRAGGRDPDDTDDEDKGDELPAYESVQVGGPPRYADNDMEDIRMVDGIPMRVLPLHISVSASQSSNDMNTANEEESPARSEANAPTISRPTLPTVQEQQDVLVSSSCPEYSSSPETPGRTGSNTNTENVQDAETRPAAGPTGLSNTSHPSFVANYHP